MSAAVRHYVAGTLNASGETFEARFDVMGIRYKYTGAVPKDIKLDFRNIQVMSTYSTVGDMVGRPGYSARVGIGGVAISLGSGIILASALEISAPSVAFTGTGFWSNRAN